MLLNLNQVVDVVGEIWHNHPDAGNLNPDQIADLIISIEDAMRSNRYPSCYNGISTSDWIEYIVLVLEFDTMPDVSPVTDLINRGYNQLPALIPAL